MRVQLILHFPLMDVMPVHNVFERLAIAFKLVDNGLTIRVADRDGHKDFLSDLNFLMLLLCFLRC